MMPESSDNTTPSVSSYDLVVAHLVIMVAIGGSLCAIVLGVDIWPFQSYSMYSQLHSDSYSYLDVRGVTEQGDEIQLPRRAIRPLKRSALGRALHRISRLEDGDERFRSSVAYLHKRYDKLRARRPDELPELVGFRLIKYHWQLQSGAVNRARPDRQQILIELNTIDDL